MDYNLLDIKYLNKLAKYIRRRYDLSIPTTRKYRLDHALSCPYKEWKARGRTYEKVSGGYMMGITVPDLAKEMGYKHYRWFKTYLTHRSLKFDMTDVYDKDRNIIQIYDSETARNISKYIIYSYMKPAKLILSYNDYIKGKDNG